jgi:hypothetical protein
MRADHEGIQSAKQEIDRLPRLIGDEVGAGDLFKSDCLANAILPLNLLRVGPSPRDLSELAHLNRRLISIHRDIDARALRADRRKVRVTPDRPSSYRLGATGLEPVTPSVSS